MNNQEKIIFIIIFIIFIWTFFILKKSTFIKSDYEPSKKNIIKTLIGLIIFHYFIFFQDYKYFFTLSIFNYDGITDSRFGRFLNQFGFRYSNIGTIHIIVSFTLLYSYWHFRKKLTCFLEELIKKFIQKV